MRPASRHLTAALTALAVALGACGTGGSAASASVPPAGCGPGLTACGDACVDLATDAAHCGACEVACSSVNGAPSCAGGACRIDCALGFDDCDAAAPGCETDLRSDPRHCGACTTACAAPNGIPACAAGACTVSACDAGFDACDADPSNGCETDLRSDPLHCGACAARCDATHGEPACVASTCGIACAAGWGDCDAAAPGCETDLAASAAHCGGCGQACSAANGAPACAGAACAIACDAGFADCDRDARVNGCEVDVRTSAAHCGGCDTPCAPPNAAGACAGGTCGVGACAPGFADCNGLPGDGCEVDLRTDPLHCGGCPTACAAPNGTPACAGGTCAVAACAAGFGDCDGVSSTGCEQDLLASDAHCGACGDACVGARCVAGTCVAPQLALEAPASEPSCAPPSTTIGTAFLQNLRAGNVAMNALGQTWICGPDQIRVADGGLLVHPTDTTIPIDRMHVWLPPDAGEGFGFHLEFQATAGTLVDRARGIVSMNEWGGREPNSAYLVTAPGRIQWTTVDFAGAPKTVDCAAAPNDGHMHSLLAHVDLAGEMSLLVDGTPCGTVVGTGSGFVSLAPYATLGSRHDPGALSAPALGTIRGLEVWLGSPAPARPPLVRYAALGDSITNGFLAIVKTPWPMGLTRDYGPGRAVHNHGVSGNWTRDMVARWTANIRGRGYRALTLLGGVNDLANAVPLNVIEGNLSQIWTEAQAEGMPVVAMTIAPWAGSARWTGPKQASTEALNAWIRAEAARRGLALVDTYALLGDSVDPTWLASLYDSGDHLHPNQAGADAIGAAVRAALPP